LDFFSKKKEKKEKKKKEKIDVHRGPLLQKKQHSKK
jgi:hypothetical protein